MRRRLASTRPWWPRSGEEADPPAKICDQRVKTRHIHDNEDKSYVGESFLKMGISKHCGP